MSTVIRAHRTPVVCGIDIGSTNTKVVALDRDSRVVGRVSRRTPRDTTDMSIDAQRLLTVVEQMIVEVCRDELVAVAVCTAGVGEDGVPVNHELAPTGPALAWFDPRRTRAFAVLRDRLDEHAGIGVDDDAARSLVGWAWARGRGELDDASSWISLTDYAASVWTGRAVMGDTVAARTAAWDGTGAGWVTGRVLATLGDARLLPEVVATGTTLGSLRSDRLTSAGVLAASAVVVAGGHDHPIGGWAVDRMDAGAILDSMGTAEVVVAQSRDRVLRSAAVDVAPGIRSTGTSLLAVQEFTRNLEWASLDPAVAAALHELAAGPREPDAFVSSDAFIAGDRGGGRPRYATDAPADPLSRASAVLGALARLGAASVDQVAAKMPTTSRVYVAGGWSRSAGWLRIKERVGDRRMLVVREPEVAAVGAAMLAADAVGWAVDPVAALAGSAATGS